MSSARHSTFLALSAFLALASGSGHADEMESCPMHAQHVAASRSHLDDVNKRGDKGMGFAQAKTAHHFTLLPDGGRIEVGVTDAADEESRSQIQAHLEHIAKAFAAGDFHLPMFIHAQTPPGAPTMRRLRSQIAYAYAPTPSGGRVTISTKDGKALAAVHAFLRFQIQEHQTGDPLTITR